MHTTQCHTHICLLLFWTILIYPTIVRASPTFSDIDYITPERSIIDYELPYQVPLTNYGLRRLRRGFYFIDDGYISAVPETALPSSDIRRQDNIANLNDENGYENPPRRRSIRTKHKKLFVPNFFG